MRICLISSSFYPATFYGGPIFATWGLSKKLAEKGTEIYVSSTNANGGSSLDIRTNIFLRKEKNIFVKYYYEEIRNMFSFAFLFGVWYDIKKADVLYIQYLFHYTVLISLLFSLIQRKKIIVCPRGSFSYFTLSNRFVSLKDFWIRYLIKPFCKQVVWQASSYLEKRDIRRNLPDANVIIINDGVDFSSFQQFKNINKQELLKRYTNIQFKEVSHIFFSMGRLHSIKCFSVLIEAFSLLVEKDLNAKLLIAGGNDGEEGRLRQQIIDLNLQHSVFLIGSVDFEDKKNLLNNSDYFSLASEFESFGIVVAEALSCGKPIILSNKTPWRDLEKNKCGIFVNNDRHSFYNGFLAVVNKKYDSDLIKDYVKSNYDWSIIADEFLSNIKNR